MTAVCRWELSQAKPGKFHEAIRVALIRHKQTKKAYWIEIKPRAYTDNEQLELRKEVSENYINSKNYDWEYKVIYDDEIKLTLDLIKQFNECCKLINKSKRKLLFQEYNNRFDRSEPSFFTTVPKTNRVEFIMFGIDRINSYLIT